MNDESKRVRELGEYIGFGRLMTEARDEWRKLLLREGLEGGEFAVGPCVTLTIPCGCTYPCDWCNGCGWLTPKVKEMRDSRISQLLERNKQLEADLKRGAEMYGVVVESLSRALDDFRSLSKSAGTKAARMHAGEAYQRVRAAYEES